MAPPGTEDSFRIDRGRLDQKLDLDERRIRVLEELGAMLAEIEVAMRPLCAPRCGLVALRYDEDDSPWEMYLDTTLAGRSSFIRVQEAFARELLEGPPTRAVLALGHEYGHHLDITMGGFGYDDTWGAELRATALGGCAAARSGVHTADRAQEWRECADLARHLPAPAHPATAVHPHWVFLSEALVVGVSASARRRLRAPAVAVSRSPDSRTSFRSERCNPARCSRHPGDRTVLVGVTLGTSDQ